MFMVEKRVDCPEILTQSGGVGASRRAALGKNVSVLIGREPGKCGHIFPGKDVSVLIGREAIFADRQASRNASLNAPFFPRTAPSDPPLGSGVCGAQSCLGAQEMVYFQPRAKALG